VAGEEPCAGELVAASIDGCRAGVSACETSLLGLPPDLDRFRPRLVTCAAVFRVIADHMATEGRCPIALIELARREVEGLPRRLELARVHTVCAAAVESLEALLDDEFERD
jgi:hypothetical protein